jgi:hypothetical protein
MRHHRPKTAAMTGNQIATAVEHPPVAVNVTPVPSREDVVHDERLRPINYVASFCFFDTVTYSSVELLCVVEGFGAFEGTVQVHMV